MANSGTLNGAVLVTDVGTSRTNLGLGNIAVAASPLSIANGGRNSGTTPTVNAIVGTNSTVLFLYLDSTPNGRTLISGSSSTSFALLTGGTGITLTNGANSISFTLPTTSTVTRGGYTLATSAETVTGTDANKGVVPSALAARLAAPGTIGGTTLGAATFTYIELGTVGGVQFLAFSGDPNGTVTAPQGSWCTNIGTPVGLVDRVFINTNGGTTWTGITSVA